MSDVQITVDLPYPAEVVWRALTERRLMSEWFLPTDLAPVTGGVYRVFPPPGLAGFGAPFDVDVLEVVERQRLLQRWRGEELHTEMLWEISPSTSGCRLRVVQSGFLGLQGDRRRAELLDAYETLFSERLPALLARLALDDVLPPPPVRVPLQIRPPRTIPWWKRIFAVPETRVRLLSIAGAVVITVLVATALATFVLRPHAAPADAFKPDLVPGLAHQPAPSGSASPVPHPSAVPSGQPSPVPVVTTPIRLPSITAAYHTAESYNLSYIGSISITAVEAIDGWTAIIELPQGTEVTSAWDQIRFKQTGHTVTFTPVEVHRKIDAGVIFTFSFQIGGGGSPSTCTVNGVKCSGV